MKQDNLPKEMNRIYPKLPNGDMGRDCEVEKWCGEPAYQLSWSDTQIGNIKPNGIATYQRIVRYKCLNGHRFDKEKTVEKDWLSGNGKQSVVRANVQPKRKLANRGKQ